MKTSVNSAVAMQKNTGKTPGNMVGKMVPNARAQTAKGSMKGITPKPASGIKGASGVGIGAAMGKKTVIKKANTNYTGFKTPKTGANKGMKSAASSIGPKTAKRAGGLSNKGGKSISSMYKNSNKVIKKSVVGK